MDTGLGRTDEALVELRHAMDLDPRAPAAASAVAVALLSAGRYSDALIAARRSVTIDSSFVFGIWTMAFAQALGGQPDSAVATLERGLQRVVDIAAGSPYPSTGSFTGSVTLAH